MQCALKIFRAQANCRAHNSQSSAQNLKICLKNMIFYLEATRGQFFQTRICDGKNIFHVQKTNFPVWHKSSLHYVAFLHSIYFKVLLVSNGFKSTFLIIPLKPAAYSAIHIKVNSIIFETLLPSFATLCIKILHMGRTM